MKFYTSAVPFGNHIFHRWIEDGNRYTSKVKYTPTYYVPSTNPSEFKTLKGETVTPVQPGSMKECRDWIERYKDVSGFNIYGDIGHQYQFIGDQYPGAIDFDPTWIRVANLDIETAAEHGFGLPENPTEEVTAITVKVAGKFHVFACGDFRTYDPEIIYTKCRGEYDLLTRFLNFWSSDYPDIITGWNVDGYDVPYLVNRITRIIGEEQATRLSPCGFLKKRIVNLFGRDQEQFQLYGIAILDYLQLFKKFTLIGKSQESYKLDDIAWLIAKDRKVAYDGALHLLYKNDFQKFIEYNIHDTRLVGKIDDELQLITLAMILAYNSKVNFEDVFFQTRMWDGIIYNFLREKNIVIPPRIGNRSGSEIKGAYVKEPQVGMFGWLVSFDFSGLYPSLMVLLGISPENYLGQYFQSFDMDKLVRGEYDLSEFAKSDTTIGANGAMFKKKLGFFPEIIIDFGAKRKFYKKNMLEAKKDQTKKHLVAKFDAYQSSIKVALNSLYGCCANSGFRYYNPNLAEAITITGQAAIKRIIIRVNEYLNGIMKTEGIDYVLAADTDSSYLNLGPLIDKLFTKEYQKKDPHQIVRFINKICEETIQPFIQNCCDELTQYLNGNAGSIDMKRESIASSGVWTGKKKYVLNVYDKEGVTYPEPKIEVTGIEVVRSSTPRVVRDNLKEALKIIMNGSNDEILRFNAKFKKEFMKLPVEDISSPRGVNDLDKYADPLTIWGKGATIQAKGSLIYNHMIKKLGLETTYPFITTSEKIKFVYLKQPNPLGVPVIAFPGGVLPPEFDIHDFIDRRTQYEKTFFGPISRILQAIGWQSELKNTLF